ncbi:hypothetical protein ES703_66163 [subsurface metagenome]
MNNKRPDDKNTNKGTLLRIIQDADKRLEKINHSPFSTEAFATLKEKVGQYVTELVLESIKTSERYQSDTISKTYVERASLYLFSSKSRKLYKNLGMFGGIILGASVSNIITMITSGNYSTLGVILAIVLVSAAIFMITLGMVKD